MSSSIRPDPRPPRTRPYPARAVAVTAALVLGLAGVAAVHRSPQEGRLTSTTQILSTRPQQGRLVCPPAPRLQASSSDSQFDPGRGVSWSRTLGAAVGSATTSFGSAPLPPATRTGTPAPSSSPPAPGTTPSASDGSTEVPRPSASATTGPALRPLVITADRHVGSMRLVDRPGTTSSMIVATPVAGRGTQAGGIALSVSASGDLRGISAGPCVDPAVQTWLVGGRSGSGVGSRVVVSNPADTAATVDLSLLTPTGTAFPATGRGIVVAPRSTREVLLRSLTPDGSTMAVGVSSSGAPVGAFLVDQRVSGTRPAGVDVVSGTDPARRVVLMGRTGSSQDAVLRVAVPGPTAASLAYRVEDTGGTYGTPQPLTVAAGTSLDVPLPTGPAHDSRVVIESDQPVVAGLELSRRAGGVVDQTWATGAQVIRTPVVVPVPRRAGLDAALVVSAADRAGVGMLRVQRRDAAGRPLPDVQVSVPANGVTTLPAQALGTAASLILRPSGSVYATLGLSARGGDGRDTMLATVGIPAPPGSRIDTAVQHAVPGDLP